MITHYACLNRMKNYLDLYSKLEISPIAIYVLSDQLRHLPQRGCTSIGNVRYVYGIPKAVYGIHECLLEWESLY